MQNKKSTLTESENLLLTASKDKKIAVIYGGVSNERAVSIASKNSICEVFAQLKIPYQEFELNKDIAENLVKCDINLVINAIHGKYGEDGRLPAMLDILQIPYTHSDFFASNIAMNKLLSKQYIGQIKASLPNFKLPKYVLIENINQRVDSSLLTKPFILKPVSEGSSIGVKLYLKPEECSLQPEDFKYGPILLEEYIEGQEINVAVINNKSVGVAEVKTTASFYDYQAKYSSSKTEYIFEPKLSDDLLKKILLCAENIHNFFKCNYLSRSEFIIKGEDIYFLELNTHPGFTKTSLIPKIAKGQNIDFSGILAGLIDNAQHNVN
jgi:D-alanine-D-alanine ligase